jgi:prepilin-type N-terminal cleavage/methylation domain-containing protein
MFSKSANNKGFTLLELIIVMAIIAILSATVILNPGILDNRNKALDTGNLDLAAKIQQQIFTYYLTTGNDLESIGVNPGDLSSSKQKLIDNGIISADTNIPQGLFYLQFAPDKTPNVGFSLASTQFKTTSSCFSEDLSSSTTCTGTYFFVPKSGRLGTKVSTQ